MNDNTLNQRSLIFLLGSMALITLPHVQHLPSPLFSFFLSMLLWRALGVWRPQWLPNRFSLFLLTLLGIAILISQQKSVFGRDAGTSLIVVALGLKLLEIHGRRDVYLIAYLAFIVATSQFLYEQSILMAGYILLVSVLLLTTLISQNAPQIKTLLAIKSATLIILQALPLAIIIFVAFPRLEAPHWMWLQEDNKAISGLTNTLEPGSISQLSMSDELVFRVRFNGETPPPQQRYWRGPVYSKTDGIRWSVDKSDNHPVSEPIFSGQTYTYTVLMEPQKEAWVFGLEMAETFAPSLNRSGLYQLLTSKKTGERSEYQLKSRPFYNTGDISKSEYQANLQLPTAASAKQLELIRHLQGFEAKPEQFIQNLLQHFRQEKFYYTLTPPLMPNDPIDTFLFETRSGFCSHYATAFVYLLRIAQIPARVVGGYQGGEINKVGGFLEVRQADAHAWAEAWIETKGWVRFDPTAAIAPERIERGVNVDLQIASGAVNFAPIISNSAAVNWLKRSRHLWQSIDYNWQRWVINYNSDNQMQFLQSLGIEGIASLIKWLLGCVLLITLPLAWWLLRSKTKATDKAVIYYQRFCAKLARIGIEIRVGEGAKDFAERARKQRPDLAAPIESITTLFIRLRYEEKVNATDLSALKKASNQFSA